MEKRGLEFTFAWLFTIIVGAAILFIAIYATTQFISTSSGQTNAQITEQVGIILEKVETSLEDSSSQQITFPDETRMINKCRESGTFGEQSISTSTRSNIGKEWQSLSTEKIYYDSYIFSSDIEQGSLMNVFVKKFEFPFEVADLIYIYTDEYCFISPPGDVEDEIRSLRLNNVYISPEVACPRESLSVCFGAGCDIEIDANAGKVTKGQSSLYYGDNEALMYAAIFSDANIYECQLKRLMKRTGELAQVYAAKSELLDSKGCGSGLAENLRVFSAMTNIQESRQIGVVIDKSDEIWRANERLSCKLF